MRPHQKRLWPCFALLLLLPPALGAPEARPRRPYDGDRRLQRAVELPPAVGTPLSLTVRRLSDETGVTLKCDNRLRAVPMAVASQPGARAVDVMESLEIASGAVWLRRMDGYALVETPETLPWCLKPEAEVEADRQAALEALRAGLTPEQRRRLGEGERLRPADLTRAQQEALSVVVRCCVALDPDWLPEALVSDCVWLRLQRDTPVGATVDVMLPSAQMECNIEAAAFLL
jgi:hypothetical protein